MTFEGHFRYYKCFHCLYLEDVIDIIYELNYNSWTLHVSNYFYSLSRLDGTRECMTAAYVVVGCRRPAVVKKEKEVKEVGLCSAFIVVPHTQGAQVRITQFYLQITPYYTSTS